jgi:uncharacterized iron-regulated membrane protein
MLTKKTIKTWYLVHKWTSLVCTVFLLLLCVTGLPLVFYEELEHALGIHPEAAEAPPGAPLADIDAIGAQALAAHPGQVLQYLTFDPDHPLVYTTTAPDPMSADVENMVFDAHTGAVIDAPPFDEGILYFFYRLHVDLFLALPGMLFLGLMGLLFVIAIVSGVVVYAPFMRKLDFGTLRRGRSARVRWLDTHNLLGAVTMAWALVVGVTGIINTLSTPILYLWQADQLAEIVAPYEGLPPPTQLGSVTDAVETARAAAPDMIPSFVAYPGTIASSDHHYAVFMQGATPFTSRLLKPALIDAQTGELTDMRSLPWYATVLLLSQPLHFGDYGGMPMKIIWALLDLVTIVVLGSGLYLWLGRRRPVESRLAELLAGGEPERLAAPGAAE